MDIKSKRALNARTQRRKRQVPRTGWLERSAKGSMAPSGQRAALYPSEKFKASKKWFGETPIAQLRAALDRFQQPQCELREDLERGLRGRLFYDLSLFAGRNPDCFTKASRDDLLATLERFVSGARELLTGARWRLAIAGPITQVISKEYDGPRKPRAPRYPGDRDGAGWKTRFERWYDAGDFATAFLLRAGDLLIQPGLARSLAACARADCGRLFVKQKRGLFCGRRCAQLEHVRRWRSRQSAQKLSDRRHGYYLNRLAKEQKRTIDQVRKNVRRRPRESDRK